MSYLCVEKGGRSCRVVGESERERMAGNETISRHDGAARNYWQKIRESELEDRECVPGVGVPWNPDGFAETNGESGGRVTRSTALWI